MKNDLSLSMGPIQVQINESFRPKTTDTYGSLFEFLDGNDSTTTQDRGLKKKLFQIKRQVNQKIMQENEGVSLFLNFHENNTSISFRRSISLNQLLLLEIIRSN